MSTLLRGPGSLALLGEAARSTNRPARGGAGSWARQLAEFWPDGGGSYRIEQTLNRHAAREGFRLVVAETDSMRVGFGYGHVGTSGQWWHDSVAAHMTPTQRKHWLRVGHFEVVELHVRAECRQRGVGGKLLDALLRGLTAATVVASVRADNLPALATARSRGFETILGEFRFARGDAPYCILGLER
jgi:ribosomal protein S18 acetylase RimI-like enzyme